MEAIAAYGFSLAYLPPQLEKNSLITGWVKHGSWWKNEHVKFTREDVKGNSLAFLDCAVKITEDRNLTIEVYRKPTHTDQYLQFDSHHPLEHKLGAGCKTSLVFFQYFIMANFFWLLVEGLYLHTLLVVIFSENRHFIVYLFIGWGRCWETNDNPIPNWVINGPIGFSIMVNFLLFVSIIRILVQKLRCPDVGGNDQSQYRRLAKSTLLLMIPLFGIHYVIFVTLGESIAEDYKIFFDLALGSFQGLVVAILYCFLNSELQVELKRIWRIMCLNAHLSGHHSNSTFRSGSELMAQSHRNSRAQSIMQSETTVL
ncbi:Vasoactive intestinal polypeptide receptor 2 [Takifugu flavidus]|uniref:Vasoactive intestinal polypeptide receptor 2 n=1 Tax=Takifugu flavidus TaxID=433684 RepID=A0A5C6P1V3_9TELE|nr:Vasoactive intestinal polypeptide receptor 2 [Takifugu flavidus]